MNTWIHVTCDGKGNHLLVINKGRYYPSSTFQTLPKVPLPVTIVSVSELNLSRGPSSFLDQGL